MPTGEPVYCSGCSAPIVLYRVPAGGYRLVCGCPSTGVSIDPVVSESNLFEPISGKWSALDDVDPWEDTEVGDLKETESE